MICLKNTPIAELYAALEAHTMRQAPVAPIGHANDLGAELFHEQPYPQK